MALVSTTESAINSGGEQRAEPTMGRDAATLSPNIPAVVSAPSTPLQPAESETAVDPIDESPAAVWYVRPATGGQFGPASGEIMRAWISEGRVGASSLVWRAGWPEWRAASAVFPALGKLLASPVATATVQAVMARPVAASQPESPAPSGGMSSNGVLPPVALSMRKRRRKNDRALIVSGILLAITLVLVAVLILVWQNQQSAEDADEPVASEVTDARPTAEFSVRFAALA